jgi:hypothetical protein
MEPETKKSSVTDQNGLLILKNGDWAENAILEYELQIRAFSAARIEFEKLTKFAEPLESLPNQKQE